jgi:predicted amidophosphoribosyltransferase
MRCRPRSTSSRPGTTLLHQLKYGAALGLAPALGALMAARMALPEDALLLPVPLHPRRLGERGYNQAALLAAELARTLRRPWRPDLLRRVIDTPAQARLTPRRTPAQPAPRLRAGAGLRGGGRELRPRR